MQLPKYFTTVTPISKILAMIIFVSLPFLGFYFGQKFKVCDICPVNNSKIQPQVLTVTPTSNITSGKVAITDNNNRWGTYVNERGIKFSFPPGYEIGYTGTNIYNEDYFSIDIPPKEEMMPGSGYGFYVKYDPGQKSLVEYVASEVSLMKSQHTADPNFKILNEKIIKFGIHTAYQFTVEASQSPSTDEIFFFNNGVGLHISETGVPYSEHLQVMSSIVFTDAKK